MGAAVGLVGLLWLGWVQENRWSLVGAGAAMVAGVSMFLAPRMATCFLPTVLVGLPWIAMRSPPAQPGRRWG